MRRRVVGIFDPGDRIQTHRLALALAPQPAHVIACGPLKLAHSGPPQSGERSAVCLLDGHLDNVMELCATLELPTSAPAERLLAEGWRRWRRGLLPRLRGEFVLVIWDSERRQGILARDQLGTRSLYLADFPGGVWFAGEVRDLLALLPQRPAPDPVSVAHWLAMSDRPGTATMYRGIRRLNPASLLALDRAGAREERYWAPSYREPLSGSRAELAGRLSVALDRAVRRRVDGNGSTAVLMSGGLDSASVAAIAATAAPGRVHAYSAVFPEHPAVDESELIEQLRARLRLGGATARVRAGGLLSSALAATETWQLPLRSWGDFWALPLLRAAACAGMRVALGGDGGDELFGVRAYLLADRLRAGHPLEPVGLARRLPGAGDRPPRRELLRVYRQVALAGALPYNLQRGLQERLTAGRPPAWLRRRAACDLLDSRDPLAWKRLDGPRWWAETAHSLTRRLEEAGMCESQHRRAAAAGLEARHPLLDFELVALCLRLPPLSTFDPHRNRPLLRESMAGRLPDAVRLRPGKARFDSLIADCLAGADGAAVRRLITDSRAELGAYVDLPRLTRLLFSSPLSIGRFEWMSQLWRVVTAECWLRRQADRAVVPALGDAKPSRPRVSVQSVPSDGENRLIPFSALTELPARIS